MIEGSSNLSLIIPCYNEQDNLPLLFKKLLKIQVKFNEIILVDNGSTDNTSLIIENFIKNNDSCIKILKLKKNIGYGNGIMSGIRKSSGKIIAWTHADLQTDPQDVVDAYEYFMSKNGDSNFFIERETKKKKIF